MLTKTPRAGKQIEVTFRMSAIDGVAELFLCGDFNDWQTAGIPLRQDTDGSWVTTVTLEAGKSYRFRYHDNLGRWHNDWDADAYVPNAFGSEDSVVDLAAYAAQVQHEASLASPDSRRPARRPAAKRTGPARRPPPRNTPRARRRGTGRRGPRG